MFSKCCLAAQFSLSYENGFVFCIQQGQNDLKIAPCEGSRDTVKSAKPAALLSFTVILIMAHSSYKLSAIGLINHRSWAPAVQRYIARMYQRYWFRSLNVPFQNSFFKIHVKHIFLLKKQKRLWFPASRAHKWKMNGLFMPRILKKNA